MPEERLIADDHCTSGRISNIVKTRLALLVGLTTLGAVLRWPSIAGGSLWFDEWVTQALTRTSATRLLPDIKGSESTPPLYYVIAWLWAKVFGSDAFALRSLSGVFGVATIPVAYLAAVTIAPRRIALIATAFVAVNPLLVWYSTEARAYALLVLLSTLSLLMLGRVLVRPDRRNLALWALSSSLLLTAHYFGAFVVAAEATVLLARPPCARRSIAFALIPVAITAALLLPLAYLQRGHTTWIEQLPLDSRIEELGRNLLTGVSAPDTRFVSVVIGLAVAATMLLLTARARERRAAAVWLATGGLAIALPLLLGIAGADYVLTRNLIGAAVPLLFVLAVGCGARAAGWFGLTVAGAIVAASLAIVGAIATDERLQRVDWNQAAELLGPGGRDRMILAWGDYRLAPLFDDLGPPQTFARNENVVVREIVLLGFERPRGRISCWSGAACNMYDVALRDRLPLVGFYLVERREAGLFEVARYRTCRSGPLQWRDIVASVSTFGEPYAWIGPGPAGSSAAPGTSREKLSCMDRRARLPSRR